MLSIKIGTPLLSKLLTISLLCLIGSPKALAQQKSKDERAIRKAKLEAFLANVSSAVPEVSSDLLIKIAEAGMGLPRERRIDLLEEAFRRSNDAQQKTKRKIWSGAVDSSDGYLSAAFDQELDSLSLKTRAARALLAIDAIRAKQLLQEISLSDLIQLNCKESLTYDLSQFYRLVSSVAEKNFSATEVQQGEKLQFVQQFVERLNSPAQVSPLISVLIDSNLSSADLTVLSKSLAKSLAKTQTDPRSFNAALLHGDLVNNMDRMLGALRVRDLATTEMSTSFREYVLKQLSSMQCDDLVLSQAKVKQLWTNLDRIAAWSGEPIKPEDIKAKQTERLNPGGELWTTQASSRLLTQLKTLRFGNGTAPLTIDERNSADWLLRMDALLSDLESWDGASEKNSLMYFHEKANLYLGLFELSPGEGNKVRVLLRFAGFLRNAETRNDSRIEWLLHARGLLKKAERLDPISRQKVMIVFTNSGTTALQLYAEFDQLVSTQEKR